MPAAPNSPEPVAAPLDFRRVYDEWFHPVCRWLRALGGPDADIEDLAQEVFAVVSRKLSAFEGDQPGAWIWTITANVARAARRRAWFRHVFLGRSDTPIEELVDRRPDPAEETERRSRERDLYDLLARLSEKRRTVLILFELCGHGTDEIARLLAIPPATARTRLHHARKEFLSRAAAHRRGKEGGWTG
jgi:RNA polymerase sigma-70 factor (ECF subfamily)